MNVLTQENILLISGGLLIKSPPDMTIQPIGPIRHLDDKGPMMTIQPIYPRLTLTETKD